MRMLEFAVAMITATTEERGVAGEGEPARSVGVEGDAALASVEVLVVEALGVLSVIPPARGVSYPP